MIFHCDALATKRADNLGKYFLDPNKDKVDLKEVISFIKLADLKSRPISKGHLTNLNPPSISVAGLGLFGAGSPTLLGGTMLKNIFGI